MRDKVALISGSSSGIGRGLALALARRGCAVVVNYFSSKERALEVAAEIERLGGRASVCGADVAQVSECERLVAQALEQFGRLDFLVNNAACTTSCATAEMVEAEWDRIFAVNVKGAFFLSRAAAAALKASGGAIVNVSSKAAIDGVGSSVPYAASKAALNNLTISLARELAPQVRVNAVAPGFVDTPWAERQFGERLKSVKTLIGSRTATGRVNQVEDVVDVIVSLLTGMGQVTGQTLVVDGGYRR